jgi:hypothetical protein
MLNPLDGSTPELVESRLWEMVDYELEWALHASKSPWVREGWMNLRDRNFPKLSLSLRPEQFVERERVSGKTIVATAASPRLLKSPIFQDPVNLRRLQEETAALLGMPPRTILYVPAQRPERFIPKDVAIIEGKRDLGMLSELEPAHYQALASQALAYEGLRLCTSDEYRGKLASARAARAIIEYLEEEAAEFECPLS